MPVRGYAPELIETFRVASQEKVSIPLRDRDAAHRLRFRFHNLRKHMRKEAHPLLAIAEKVQFQIEDQVDGTCLLIASPQDNEFLDSLRAAGIVVKDEKISLEEETKKPLPDAKSTADALAKFMEIEDL